MRATNHSAVNERVPYSTATAPQLSQNLQPIETNPWHSRAALRRFGSFPLHARKNLRRVVLATRRVEPITRNKLQDQLQHDRRCCFVLRDEEVFQITASPLRAGTI